MVFFLFRSVSWVSLMTDGVMSNDFRYQLSGWRDFHTQVRETGTEHCDGMGEDLQLDEPMD